MNIEDATDIAREFARKNGYYATRLEDAKLVEGRWAIKLKYQLVGEVVRIQIVVDDESGEIVSFERIQEK